MKLVILMFLEDDTPNVERLLAEHELVGYSEVPIEGHGEGTAGWYGKVAPYASRMLLVFLSSEKADELLAAVSACTACKDPNHPIHAWQVDVEKVTTSGLPIQNANA
ncbi:MAG: hypothetical protein LJF04_01580 [Gemmatimonadetes bacterium]|nr:hypothetical protein [Gemmatimonadota bacterium]